MHPSFLPLSNLDIIIRKMNSVYNKDQLVHFKNKQNYYKFLGIQLTFKGERIIFFIHYPLLYPQQFKSYFIYPVPIHNKIISPPKPYLILNEKTKEFQYEDDSCEKIEDDFYCKNHLETVEDCVVNILTKNRAMNCSTLSVHLESQIINQVTPQNLLLSTPTASLVIEVCENEKHNELHPGSYLISIPEKCHVSIGREIFYSSDDTLSPALIVQLPSLNVSLLKEHATSLKLKSLNFDEIKQITSIMNDQSKLVLPPSEETHHSSWLWITVLICVIVCVMTYFGIRCYYRVNYPYPLIKLTRKKKNEDSESPTQLESS